MPPISLRKGPIPIFPPNKNVQKFFDYLGTTIEINNENLSLNFWSTSSMMAPFYELLYTLSSWLNKNGVDNQMHKNISHRYFYHSQKMQN